jgi:gliding motility-associated-like protein
MRLNYTFLLIFICLHIASYTAQTPAQGIGATATNFSVSNGSGSSVLSKNGSIGTMNGNEAIGTSYTATACGLNYVSANITLHQRSFPNGIGVGSAQPATFVLSGIPVCGRILRAFLYTSFEGAAVAPTVNANITNPLITNSTVPMALIGTGASKCWGGYVNSYTFRADVTGIVSGNGTYTLSGLPIAPSGNDVNGATLFVIYTDESVNYTGSIVIADGMRTGIAAAATQTITGFNVCGPTLLTSNFIIVDNLRRLGLARLSFNSSTPNFTLVPGSQVPWVFVSQAASPAVSGQSSAVYRVDPSAGFDCIGMVAAGMYYRTNCLTCPNPQTFSLTASSASCVPSGTASVQSSGGFPPLTYTWQGTAQTTSLVTGLSAGTYTVRVADNNSCRSGTTSVLIAGTLSLSASSASCNLSSTAAVTATGGIPPYNYVWSGSAQTTSLVSNLTVGPYTVTVSDFSACQTSTAFVNVTRPSTLTVPNRTVCIGYDATLTATGPSNSYTWSPLGNFTSANGNSSITCNPLVTTIYTVSHTNSLSCIGINTTQVLVVVTQTTSIANPSACVGQSLQLTPSATITGNTYNWAGPGGYVAQTALGSPSNPARFPATVAMSGSYSLTMISAPGCTTTAVAIATVFALPSPVITSNGTVCTNVPLTLNASGALNYTWTGPPSVPGPGNGFFSVSTNTSIVASSTLDSGTYTLTGAFANGCTNTATRTVLVRPLPATSFSYNSNNTLPLCRNGTLSLAGSGGGTYSWRGPNAFISFVQNPVINNVQLTASGIYTLIATLNTCTSAATESITINPLPVPTAVNNSTVCAFQTLQLSGTDGVTYTWTGPAGFTSTLQVPTIASASLANNGTYTVTVTDSNGCRASATTAATILPNPSFVITGTNVCLNAPGTITLTGGVSWLWTGPSAYTSSAQSMSVPAVDNNSAGIYSVVITNANSCTIAAEATLSFVPLPNIVPTPTTSCFNATAVLTASGAVSYTWFGPQSYQSVGSSATISVANFSTAGTYTIVGRGANSCTNTAFTTLSTTPLPSVTVVPSLSVCLREQAVLSSTVVPAPGTPSDVVNYQWNGPFVSFPPGPTAIIASAISVAPLNYTLLVTAQNTCTRSVITTLFTYPLPTVTATGTLICKNQPFTIVANGALTYAWTGPPPNSSSTQQNYFIPAVNKNTVGSYTVIGMDINTCTNTAVAQIDTLSLPVITTIGSTVCIGQKATLVASGANTYNWNGPGVNNVSGQILVIPVTTFSTAQLYTVVGTAPNSCTLSSTASLGTFPLPQPTFTAPSRICFGSTVFLKAAGAKTYTWSGPYGYFSENKDVSFPIFTKFQQGTYTLNVVDTLGCTNYSTTSLKIDQLPTGVLTSDNTNNFCVPFCSTFKLNATSTSSIVNINWLADSRTFTGETFSVCIAKETQNTVVGTFTDVIGCVNTVSFAIQAKQTPKADFVFSPDKPIESADQVFFEDQTVGDKLTTWNWYFSDGRTDVSTDKNTSYLFDIAGSFPVVLIVTNTWGCSDTIVKTIEVASDFKLFVPNSFSPNGDGVNDVFAPKGRGIKKYALSVYDRWGRIVFESSSFEVGWDGNVSNNSGSNDTFTWKINYTDVNNKVSEITGFVSQIR